LSRSQRPPSTPQTTSLVDFPLRGEGSGDSAAEDAGAPRNLERSERTASFSSRAIAFASDTLASLFTTASGLLAAMRAAGQSPTRPGLIWAAAFALYVSFFFIIAPLALFGRTLGMAVAGISAAPSATGKRLTLRESVARWFGTLGTAAAVGLPLLRRPAPSGAWTPADRMSGRTLVDD
jgi:hypothetical protein